MLKKFIIVNLFASLFFAITMGMIAYYLGAYALQFLQFFEDMGYVPLLILASVVGIFFWVLSKLTEKKMLAK